MKSAMTAVFTFKYSPRPNTPSLKLDDAIPDEEKARRLGVLKAKQREIQMSRYKRHIGKIVEVMVEGKNEARNQWIGRTAQNKMLNFTPPWQPPQAGNVRSGETHRTSFPNSLLGEMVI